MVLTLNVAGELPVVIDMDASFSITPNIADFTGPLAPPKSSTLRSVTNVKTEVTGEGPNNQKIEDANGVCESIPITAYLVLLATIQLFSPQAYADANLTISLLINICSISLTLKCGTQLFFPYQSSNNLPFMLTEKTLTCRGSSKKSANVAHTDSFANLLSFFFSSTYKIFRLVTV